MPGLYSMRISEAGGETFARAFGPTGGPDKGKGWWRMFTGIAKFDELLSGGIPKRDSLLLAGSSSSGKSVIDAQFIAEGFNQGESGLVAVFEEMPDQYTSQAVTFGFDFDFDTPQKNGKFEIIYLRPMDLPVDETVDEIVAKVKKIGANPRFDQTDKSVECC